MLPCNCGSFWTSFCGFLCTLCTPHSRRDWRCRYVLDPSGMTHVILWLPLHLVYTLHTSWLTMSLRPWSVRNDTRHSVASFAPCLHLTHVVIDDVATSLVRQEWRTSFCGFLCTLCTPHSRRDWRCCDVLGPSGMTHVILWLPLHLMYTSLTSWLTMSRRPWSIRNDTRLSVRQSPSLDPAALRATYNSLLCQ